MKTLRESLFDADLAEKNITFSSIWKPQNIIKMKCMFRQCIKLKCNLDSWEPYIKYRQSIPGFNMTSMFVGCPEKSIPDWYYNYYNK